MYIELLLHITDQRWRQDFGSWDNYTWSASKGSGVERAHPDAREFSKLSKYLIA